MQTINIETNQQDDYQVRESYRNLRTNIFLSGKDTKVVMFTSCGPNEGKSTVTMNLASSIADGGKRVLFIDCDLRKSVLVGRYRVKKGVKGLTHFLSGQNTLEEVIYQTNVPDMDVILAGPVPPNPSELLDILRFSGRFVQFFTKSCNVRHYGVVAVYVLFFPDGFKEFFRGHHISLVFTQIPENIKFKRCEGKFLIVQKYSVTAF